MKTPLIGEIIKLLKAMVRPLRRAVINAYLEKKKDHLYLGADCRVAKDTKFGKYVTIYDHVHIGGQSSVGDLSYIAEGTRIHNATIGRFVCIASEAVIGGGRHPTRKFASTHPVFYSLRKQCQITFSDANYFEEIKHVSVGNDVWIGARAIVLDGVKIGDGAVIGAGAVVTHDVPPYAIIGGVPARIIRYRFTKEERTFLLNLRWWDRDIEWLRQNANKMRDISTLMRGARNTVERNE